MPVPTPDTEVLARAVVGKEVPTGPLSPAEQTAAEIRKLHAEKNPRSTLEDLRARRPLDKRQGDGLIDSNFGTERDAAGRKIRTAGSPEATRFDNTKKEKELLLKFVEGVVLAGPERAQLRTQLEGIIKAWPPGEALFNIAGYDKDGALDEVLADPKLVAEVKKLVQEKLSAAPIEDEVTLKDREFKDLQSQETEKTTALTAANAEYTTVRSSLAQYEVTGGVAGIKLAELTRLQKNFPKLSQDLQDRQDDLEGVKEQLDRFKTQRDMLLFSGGPTAAVDALISSKESDIRGIKTTITRISNQVARKQELETEKASLEEKQKDLEEKKTKLDQERRDLERKRIAAQADLATEKIDRSDKEDEFGDSIKSIFSDASLKYLQDKITAYEATQNEKLAEEAAKAVDPAEKALLEQMKGKRWEKDKRIGIGRFGRREIRVLDGKAIQADFNSVMTANGDPKAAMKEALIANGISAADADLKVNDPKFMEKMAPQFMEKLLTRAVEAGVKFTEHDARVIIESQWGAAMIDNAVNNSEALKKAVDKLRDKGVLEGGLSKFFKEKGGGSFLKFLLFLLGGGVILSGLTGAGAAALFK